MKRSILLAFLILLPLSLPARAGSHVEVFRGPDGWLLFVDGSTFTVKGMAYSPDKVGEDPSTSPPTLRDWMIVDDNRNGKIDSPYDAFVDDNKNNIKDSSENAVGDFQLMKDMGVNTIRVYHHASSSPTVRAGYGNSAATLLEYNHPPNKDLLRNLYQTYGIRVAMGDFLGAYTIGSGADWNAGTDYRDPVQKQRMKASVQQMVMDFKDEPFLLMYVLGNENNYSGFTRTNADLFPVEYAQFLEEVTQMIHSLDPNHPVSLCIGDVGLPGFLKTLATQAPSVDIFGANVYRESGSGSGTGFGTLWSQVKNDLDKPVLITEYGDLRDQIINGELDEARQKRIHEACWKDIVANSATQAGQDNAIGGVAYSWVDMWWLDGDGPHHNLGSGGINNEWHGIFSQGDGFSSPYLRQKRLVYSYYQQTWPEKIITNPGPHPVTDLAAVSPSLTTIALEWTVPSSFKTDGSDSHFFSISQSKDPAGPFTNVMNNLIDGIKKIGERKMGATVGGLDPDTPYYYVVYHTEDFMTWSVKSNVAPGKTLAPSISPLPAGNPGSLQFSAATYSQGENMVKAIITVNRVNGKAGLVTVLFETKDGTAKSQVDYVPIPDPSPSPIPSPSPSPDLPTGSEQPRSFSMSLEYPLSNMLTFKDGETSKTFSVFLINDKRLEGNEDLTLILKNPTRGASLGIPSQATLTILDDDLPPPLVEQPHLGDGNSFRRFPNAIHVNSTSAMPIRFELTEPQHVELTVCDMQGRRIRKLVDEVRPSGSDQSADWDGTNDRGEKVVPDVYLLFLNINGKTLTKKIAILQ